MLEQRSTYHGALIASHTCLCIYVLSDKYCY